VAIDSPADAVVAHRGVVVEAHELALGLLDPEPGFQVGQRELAGPLALLLQRGDAELVFLPRPVGLLEELGEAGLLRAGDRRDPLAHGEGGGVLELRELEPHQPLDAADEGGVAAVALAETEALRGGAEVELEALRRRLERGDQVPQQEGGRRSEDAEPEGLDVGAAGVMADVVDDGVGPRADREGLDRIEGERDGHGGSQLARRSSGEVRQCISCHNSSPRAAARGRKPGDKLLAVDGELQALVDRAAALVDQAERVVVLTGAGISTDSGIPDYRGPQGVWTKNPGAEKMATLEHYLGDPEIRKRSWRSRLDSPVFGAQPNEGHRALVELERRGKLHLLITQNVDGLHLKAGTSAERVVEIHGHVREVVCWSCGERAPMERALDRVRAGEDDPPCRTCGGVLKSATVSFGQQLDRDDILRSEHAARTCDLVLAIGSTLSVWPAAGVVPTALDRGAPLVIVNLEPTEFDRYADVVLRASISDVLPAIVRGAPRPRDGANPA